MNVLTRRPCSGSGKPVNYLGRGHFQCPDCWKRWDDEPRYMKTPVHGFRYERVELSSSYYSTDDQGCHLHPSCLNCPREICVHDEARSLERLIAHERSLKIIELHNQGKGPTAISRILRVSSRTVHRILSEGPTQAPEALDDGDAAPRVSPLELQARSPYRARRPLPPLRRVS